MLDELTKRRDVESLFFRKYKEDIGGE